MSSIRKPDIDLRHMGACPCCHALICLRCVQLESLMANLNEAMDWTPADRQAARRYSKAYAKHRAERDHRFFYPVREVEG